MSIRYHIILKRLVAVTFATALTGLWLYATRELAHVMLPPPPAMINNIFLVYIFAGIVTLAVGVVWGVLYSIAIEKVHSIK